jgi:hypothetical protein
MPPSSVVTRTVIVLVVLAPPAVSARVLVVQREGELEAGSGVIEGVAEAFAEPGEAIPHGLRVQVQK